MLPPENKTFGLPPSAFTEQAAGLTALCEHFVCLGFSPQHLPTLADKSAPGPQTTSTHTYRLQIFKEQAVSNLEPGSGPADRLGLERSPSVVVLLPGRDFKIRSSKEVKL